jgi:hypothetical protein
MSAAGFIWRIQAGGLSGSAVVRSDEGTGGAVMDSQVKAGAGPTPFQQVRSAHSPDPLLRVSPVSLFADARTDTYYGQAAFPFAAILYSYTTISA